LPTALQRTPVPGPTFIRLLARIADTDVPAPGPALSDRLGQWIDWTRAVTLAGALDGRPSAPSAEAATSDPPLEDGDEVAHARATLAGSIGNDLPAMAADADMAAIDFAPYRQHCLAMQRAMLAATGRLRGRLRDQLAQRSPELARLAEVDAVMELTLSPREHRLLASVPVLLGEHFERLRAGAAVDGNTGSTSAAWLDVFHRDMQGVLHAELDVRFQPIEGLLAALRTP